VTHAATTGRRLGQEEQRRWAEDGTEQAPDDAASTPACGVPPGRDAESHSPTGQSDEHKGIDRRVLRVVSSADADVYQR
jgi:hypothetical protein